jgi:hypothetical protein
VVNRREAAANAQRAAQEAAYRRKDTRSAEWLRSRGWTCTPPEPPKPREDQPTHGAVSEKPRWNPAAEQYEIECRCGETVSGVVEAFAEERFLIHLGRVTGEPVQGESYRV